MFENLEDMVYEVPKDTEEKKATLPCSSKISLVARTVIGSKIKEMFDVAERGI